MSDTAKLLYYAHYMGDDVNASVYSYHDFCGQCRREVKHAYGSPIYPEQVNDPYKLDRATEYQYVTFCPWCGVRFDRDSLKGRPVENQRKPDHFRNPGFHAGDRHEFRDFTQIEICGHWLATSGPDELCWCKPEVTPSKDGCTISHRNVKQKVRRAGRGQSGD